MSRKTGERVPAARLARAVVELVLAGTAALGCAASWLRVRTEVAVAPILAGEPMAASTRYHPQWLLSALMLATGAGVLAVIGAVRLARSYRP